MRHAWIMGVPKRSYRQKFLQSYRKAILCRFGLMFLPHLSTALTQLHQLLIPGGRFAAAVWGQPAQVPAISMPMRIIRQRRHLSPPPAGVPGPFSLADEPLLREQFQQAGFTHIHTEHLTVTLEYISPEIFRDIY